MGRFEDFDLLQANNQCRMSRNDRLSSFDVIKYLLLTFFRLTQMIPNLINIAVALLVDLVKVAFFVVDRWPRWLVDVCSILI